MSEFEIDLPPYQGGPLHSPGTPGRHPWALGAESEAHYYNRDEPVSTNYLNIELSKDLNVESLTEEIKKGMDRAATQLGEAVRSKTGFWEIPKDTPLPDVVTQEWVQQHGEFHEAAAQKYYYQAPKPIAMNEQSVRSLIREEVHRALYPDAALANPHEHRRIEMTEESGKKWRGVLYAVDEDNA